MGASQWDRWEREDKVLDLEPLKQINTYIWADNPHNVKLDDFIRGMLGGKGAQRL